MAKGGLQRQRLEQRRQNNQIVAQLNQLKDSGYTDDQIRAQGSNAWKNLSQQTAEQLTQTQQQTTQNLAALPANATALKWWEQMNENQPKAPTPTTPGTTTPRPPAGYQGGPVSMWAGTTPGYNTAPTNPYAQREAATYGALSANQQNQPKPYVPAWLGAISNLFKRPNPATYPTGSFLSGSGQNLGSYSSNPAVYPTGSFLSGSGLVNTGVNEYLARGINIFPTLPSLNDQGGGGGGYGTGWKKFKRRGGGGRGGGWQDYPKASYEQRSNDYMPSRGLSSWSIG
jgi:hypothetical protein